MSKPQNTHGGRRPGAGRPDDPPTFAAVDPASAPRMSADDRAEAMAQFLHAVALDDGVDMKHRVAAAKALIGTRAARPATKREESAEKAQAAVTGRFGVRQPPKLVTG